MARRSRSRGTRQQQTLPTVHAHAAGLAIGSTFHGVAVPPDRSPEPVRTSRSFTDELHRLAAWLVELGVTPVALESTGIDWRPICDMLEARRGAVLLVTARPGKQGPGRKTDVHEAQWLQQLHQHGRLTPEQAELRQLRDEVKRLRMERDILKNPFCRACASLVGGETPARGLSSLVWEERPLAFWWY